MFRFSIRELVLVTTVVALSVGWWLDHRRLVEESSSWESIAVLVTNTFLETEHEVGKPWELEARLKLRLATLAPSSP